MQNGVVRKHPVKIINHRPYYSSQVKGIFCKGDRSPETGGPKKGWTKAGGSHLGPSRRNCTEAPSV
jgi:hypothetical protein